MENCNNNNCNNTYNFKVFKKLENKCLEICGGIFLNIKDMEYNDNEKVEFDGALDEKLNKCFVKSLKWYLDAKLEPPIFIETYKDIYISKNSKLIKENEKIILWTCSNLFWELHLYNLYYKYYDYILELDESVLKKYNLREKNYSLSIYKSYPKYFDSTNDNNTNIIEVDGIIILGFDEVAKYALNLGYKINNPEIILNFLKIKYQERYNYWYNIINGPNSTL